ncbi:hypothetical protein CDAR_525031 [Caerostris darwini]|uniref:Uncharacterized protein n=1 Tax=Caerostris darwini TaxID=1538125 RepID=A0AAV4QYI1_9ARAC|nr:hypothetical protein CDAR_525031 [Caerostris darwini]
MTEKETTGTVTRTFKRMICDPHGNPMLAHSQCRCDLSTLDSALAVSAHLHLFFWHPRRAGESFQLHPLPHLSSAHRKRESYRLPSSRVNFAVKLNLAQKGIKLN